jgi:hypothetical protein
LSSRFLLQILNVCFVVGLMLGGQFSKVGYSFGEI